jgi:hypothetical protein
MTTPPRLQVRFVDSIWLLWFFGILATGGCTDNSLPTTLTSPTHPNVAGHWVGMAHEQREPTVNDFMEYQVRADFSQDGGMLGGTWVWTITRMSGRCLTIGGETWCRFAGSIDSRGNIIIQDTSVVFVNWRGAQWTHSGPLAAALSPRGDTIAGGGYGKVSANSNSAFAIGKQ